MNPFSPHITDHGDTLRPGLNIDRLDLRLPAGYEKRANNIARETARQLSRLPLPSGDHQLASLSPPTLRLAGGETDRVIGRRIAQGISRQLHTSQAPTAATQAGQSRAGASGAPGTPGTAAATGT